MEKKSKPQLLELKLNLFEINLIDPNKEALNRCLSHDANQTCPGYDTCPNKC